MAPHRFLVVEYDGQGLPLAEWTVKHPGTQVDMILEPMRAVDKDLRIPGILLARGMRPDAFAALRDLLDRVYSPHDAIRADARRGEWLGRFTLHVENMVASPAARAVALRQKEYGPPWSHVDEGVVHMRMRLPEVADAEAVAAKLRAELAQQGADAQVMLQEFSAHDYSVWEELVQASIGLRP